MLKIISVSMNFLQVFLLDFVVVRGKWSVNGIRLFGLGLGI